MKIFIRTCAYHGVRNVFRKIWRALFSWNTRFEVRLITDAISGKSNINPLGMNGVKHSADKKKKMQKQDQKTELSHVWGVTISTLPAMAEFWIPSNPHFNKTVKTSHYQISLNVNANWNHSQYEVFLKDNSHKNEHLRRDCMVKGNCFGTLQ